MIQVNKLKKAYGLQVLFDDVSFSLNKGERVGLVGRNGQGKTTLFKILLDQESHDSGNIKKPNHYTIDYLSQHICFSEETVLKEACLSIKPSEYGCEQTYKAEIVLHGLGFSSTDFHRDPRELSGGYQVRLNLAKLLVSEPDLLLLDEPTNYLDIVSLRWLKRFLLGWKGELILITHDRAIMDSVTTHTMGIHRYKVKKIAGPTTKYYKQIIQEEELYKQRRINDEKKRKEAEQFIIRFRAKATKAKAVQSRIKALGKKGKLRKLAELKNLDFSFNAAPIASKWILKVDGLSFSYTSEGPQLIDDLSFVVGKNDRIGIIGKNGKGKTTLLNLLAKEIAPLNGNINCHPNLKTAYFGQTNIDRLNSQKTVEQEIMDVHPDFNRKAVRNICGAMMFEGDLALKKVSVLSGGERSRVLLGKLLVSPSNLLLLDEPTNHLDMESTESLMEAVDAFDGAVMIVTHSEMILKAVATRLIVFDHDKVRLFEGTYQDFLDRCGWEDENETIAYDSKAGGVRNRSNKKELKRIRAEIITERSKIMGELRRKISKIEDEIVRLEKEVEQDTYDLLVASQNGDGAVIQRLSKSIHNSKQKIEVLFHELDVLTQEHDKKAGEFEERLNMLAENLS